MSDLVSSSTDRSWLITLCGAPHCETSLKAGTDVALAAGAFDQKVILVFAGAGLELLKEEAPRRCESLHRLLGSLPYYEIDQVHALTSSAQNMSFRNDLEIIFMTPKAWTVAAATADIVVNY